MKASRSARTPRRINAVLIGLLLTFGVLAQTSQRIMTFATVKAMAHGGVSVTTIIQAITTAADVDFLANNHDHELFYLVDSGISESAADEILEAMHERVIHGPARSAPVVASTTVAVPGTVPTPVAVSPSPTVAGPAAVLASIPLAASAPVVVPAPEVPTVTVTTPVPVSATAPMVGPATKAASDTMPSHAPPVAFAPMTFPAAMTATIDRNKSLNGGAFQSNAVSTVDSKTSDTKIYGW